MHSVFRKLDGRNGAVVADIVEAIGGDEAFVNELKSVEGWAHSIGVNTLLKGDSQLRGWRPVSRITSGCLGIHWSGPPWSLGST